MENDGNFIEYRSEFSTVFNLRSVNITNQLHYWFSDIFNINILNVLFNELIMVIYPSFYPHSPTKSSIIPKKLFQFIKQCILPNFLFGKDNTNNRLVAKNSSKNYQFLGIFDEL